MTSTAKMDHAFCVPAYGQADWLDKCLASLRTQTDPDSEIVIITSTPGPHIESVAREYSVRLLETGKPAGIASDWNFALQASSARLVTLAHQDDTYSPNYVAAMKQAFARHPDCLLAFSRYSEHTATGPRPSNLNMSIKNLLSEIGFLGADNIRSARAKRRLLCLGNPVCCPSVTLDRSKLPDFQFDPAWRTNLDWDAWLRLAQVEGSFSYLRQPLVSKGIHPGSETSATIANQVRALEDEKMFGRMWPAYLATILMHFYRRSYASNET